MHAKIFLTLLIVPNKSMFQIGSPFPIQFLSPFLTTLFGLALLKQGY